MQVPLTPLEFKRRAAQLFGAKIGVIDGDRRFTYREFGERCDRLANALLAASLRLKDRVAYLAYNSYPLLEGYYGVLQARGILLPINIRLSPVEISFILNDAEAAFLLVDAEFEPLLDAVWPRLECKPQLVWLSRRPEGRAEPLYDEWLEAASSDDSPPLMVDENDTAELFYTSGTTGKPKGVMLTHRNLYLHALSKLLAFGAREPDVQLHTIPLFHVNGWGTPQSMTAVGATHVMLRKFDPAEVLRLIEAERVTRCLLVPTMLNLILNHPELASFDVSSLDMINTGGAPTPPEMVRRAQEVLGCSVIGGYGLTETSPVVAFADDKSYLQQQPEEHLRRRASTGLPVIGVDCGIVADDGGELPWDGESVGELRLRSNLVMAGYWKDAEATEAVIRNGWFYTGDLAVIDPEGYITIVDRKKDIIISGGENISSVEIEKVLVEHAAVLEVSVIGVPDDEWGEVPKALVVRRPGHEVEPIELLTFCHGKLARYKLPKSVEFVESLPKGGTGKVLKAQLREPYWQGREKRVH